MAGRQEYDNTNRGALYKNDKKRGDNDPDYTGVGNLDGADCYVNAWITPKEKRGPKTPLLKLSFKAKGERAEPPKGDPKPAPGRQAPADGAPFDDEIPW